MGCTHNTRPCSEVRWSFRNRIYTDTQPSDILFIERSYRAFWRGEDTDIYPCGFVDGGDGLVIRSNEPPRSCLGAPYNKRYPVVHRLLQDMRSCGPWKQLELFPNTQLQMTKRRRGVTVSMLRGYPKRSLARLYSSYLAHMHINYIYFGEQTPQRPQGHSHTASCPPLLVEARANYGTWVAAPARSLQGQAHQHQPKLLWAEDMHEMV